MYDIFYKKGFCSRGQIINFSNNLFGKLLHKKPLSTIMIRSHYILLSISFNNFLVSRQGEEASEGDIRNKQCAAAWQAGHA